MRGYGALFVMRRRVPSRMLKVSDIRNPAFEVMRGLYFKRCWRTGQVRHSLPRALLADEPSGDV